MTRRPGSDVGSAALQEMSITAGHICCASEGQRAVAPRRRRNAQGAERKERRVQGLPVTTRRPTLPENGSLLLQRPTTTTQIYDPQLEENQAKVKELLIKVEQMEEFVKQGVNQYQARSILQELESALEFDLLLQDEDFLHLANMLAMIVLRSPLLPCSPEFTKSVELMTDIVAERLSALKTPDLCTLMWVYGSFGPAVLQSNLFPRVQGVLLQICVRLETDPVESVKDAIRLFYGLQNMKFSGHSRATQQTLRRLVPCLRSQDARVSDLATLVLLSAKLKVPHPDSLSFVRMASRLVKHRFHEFSDTALKDFVRGFVIYDLKILPKMFDALVDELGTRLGSMKISILIQIVLDLSKINYLPQDAFLSTFSERVLQDKLKLKTADVTACALAMGQLSYNKAELTEMLAERFCHLSSFCGVVEICNALLGFTRLDALTEEMLTAGLTSLTNRLSFDMQKPQKLIVHEVLTHARLFLKLESVPTEIFPENWQAACRKKWETDQKRPIYESMATVLKTAELLGLQVQEMQSSAVGQLSIFVLSLPDSKRQVVIDLCAIKDHFFMNQSSIMLPWKQWQYRVLREQGFEILSIQEDQWKQVPASCRMRHLAVRLDFWSMEQIEAREEEVGIRENHDALFLD